ncbi:PepSY domain-containing protein [Mesorhizobium sp. AR07]|uniref:PepSY domain-containing protein n=1 Tax=Mesorhizobium sp. AR07 TaxID=2865838 RepID=UPI00215DDD84|nr:PepSY domain-containing protein [Mesorhizobium sp. AR07]UVK42775.1 PepSY domain-containing protein [Mesorhizobium sp. AR07]
MKSTLKCLAMVSLYGLVVAWPLAARAEVDDDGDHDRARDLYDRGEIKGLSNILGVVRAEAPGDIVAVDFIRIGNRWVYRFQIVAADGRRRIVDVDAGTGVLMRGEGGD